MVGLTPLFYNMTTMIGSMCVNSDVLFLAAISAVAVGLEICVYGYNSQLDTFCHHQ